MGEYVTLDKTFRIFFWKLGEYVTLDKTF